MGHEFMEIAVRVKRRVCLLCHFVYEKIGMFMEISISDGTGVGLAGRGGAASGIGSGRAGPSGSELGYL